MNNKELNIQVAKIVLGQVSCPHWRFIAMGIAGWGYERLKDCPHGDSGCYFEGTSSEEFPDQKIPFTPHYSEAHDAAFWLVEAVCKANPQKPSFILARNYSTGRYCAEFVWGTEVLGTGDGATAPEAICHAAIDTKKLRD